MIGYREIIDIFLIILEAFILIIFFLSFSGKKEVIHTKIFENMCFTIFYTILSYWGSKYIPVGMYSICVIIIAILLMSFISHTNIYNTGIIILMASLFIGILDITILGASMFIFQMDWSSIMASDLHYAFYTFTSKSIQVICTIIIFKVNNKIKISLFKSENNQYIYIVTHLVLMAIFISSIIANINRDINIVTFSIFLAVLFVLDLVLAVFDIREREQILKLVSKKKQQEDYIKNLEDVIKVIRREKHDFSNHIQILFALFRMNKPNALQEIGKYLTRLSSDLVSTYIFYNTGNIYVDGLLAIKSNVCFEKSISLEVNIIDDFSNLNADKNDIAGIVGNIINNSIECLLSDFSEFNKRIIFATFIKGDHYHIRISNNGPEIPNQYINKLFDNGFTTKADSSDHGYGLYIVSQLIQKNNGRISVTSTNQETVFEMFFNAKDALYENAG